MTKQEQIRGGIDRILRNPLLPEDDVTIVEDGFVKGRMIYFISQRRKESLIKLILSYLHSRGVVLEVKCPDCEWSQVAGEVVGMTPCYSCDSTGYRIEPLTEEKPLSPEDAGLFPPFTGPH